MIQIGVVDESRTRELRRRVLRPNLRPGDPLPGDEVPDSVHVAALDTDGAALCTCFVYPEECFWLPGRPAWHLRQMATAEAHRGEGLGSRVLAFTADLVRSRGAAVLWCNARETAVGFYERAGFQAHGGVFTDERHRLPHVRMWLELPDGATSST